MNRNDPTAPVGCQHKLAAGEQQFLGSELLFATLLHIHTCPPVRPLINPPPTHTHAHLKRPVNADGSVPEGNRV